MSVRFLLDGEVIAIDDADPTATLLDFLRYHLARTGTKEGCAEGDCGACTVLVGNLNEAGDGVDWRALNSCILFLPMMQGKALLTVESLGACGAMNPLQQVMATNGSSQCGFCTPGFVMSLQGRAIDAQGCDLPVADVIAGNLCRCTGYGPILDAAEAVPRLERDEAETVAALKALAVTHGVGGSYGTRQWFAPQTGWELCEVLAAQPDARMVAGATDVGLWVTKGLREIETLVFLGDVAELRGIEESADGLTLGAAVTYAKAHQALGRLHPDMGELVRRIGGLQVRSAASIGGNIANGSPIGDGPPALIALGASLTLRSTAGRRTMPLEDYFLDYGKQDRAPGEFVESIHVPRPAAIDVIQITKLSRRFDSDISAVCGAIRLVMEGGKIREARVAFGGMAATPCRAAMCEAALTGQILSDDTLEAAAHALREDFTPLSDVRGSAEYRLEVAANLLRRLWLRRHGVCVSVLDLEEADG